MTDEMVACRGTSPAKDWTFTLVLFRGRLAGELRFELHGAPKFTVPVDEEEIAMFASARWDLVEALVMRLIAEHRPH